MFKKITLSNRINIVLALIAVFLLILGTNRIDKRHFETAQNAVTSVYNDRVLAQDYIYKMSNLIHEKQLLELDVSRSINTSINKELETLMILFSETKLTVNEANTFRSFKKNFESLKAHEDNYYRNIATKDVDTLAQKKLVNKNPINSSLKALNTDLNNLALIQVSETKSVLGVAQQSLNANKLLSNMEIYFLLIIGVIVLFFTFYRIDAKNRNKLDFIYS